MLEGHPHIVEQPSLGWTRVVRDPPLAGAVSRVPSSIDQPLGSLIPVE